MRLFTAIELDAATLEDATRLAAELRRRVQERAARARVTWVPPERLHLTVRFIGEVDATAAERVMSALREPLPLAPFAAGFDRAGAFPPKGAPRVLWIGVGEGREAVIRLETAIGDRLASAGIAREHGAYTPHLTVARVREAGGLRQSTLFDRLTPRLAPTRVDAITLFQSSPSPAGPAYTVLQRTALRAPV